MRMAAWTWSERNKLYIQVRGRMGGGGKNAMGLKENNNKIGMRSHGQVCSRIGIYIPLSS